MKFFALLIPFVLIGQAAQAQTATRLGELRQLLQQKAPVYKAPATEPSPLAAPSASPDARQLSPEERAELRRQLTEFRRPGKGS